MRPWPQAPKGFVGLINYRGQAVPAIDLGLLTAGTPAAERLSTRIIIVRLRAAGGAERLLGLVAEQATQMIRKDPAQFLEPGFNNPGAPYVGPFMMDSEGTVHWISPDRLLSDEVREMLLSEPLALAS